MSAEDRQPTLVSLGYRGDVICVDLKTLAEAPRRRQGAGGAGRKPPAPRHPTSMGKRQRRPRPARS